MVKKLLHHLLYFIGIVSCITGCSTNEQQEKERTLKIGLLSIQEAFPFHIAEQQKEFEKDNLKIEFEIFQSAAERDIAFQSNNCDGIISDLVGINLLNQAQTPSKVVRLLTSDPHNKIHMGIVLAPNKNIPSLKDLKGTLALSPHTLTEYVADHILKSQEVPLSNIEKTTLGKIPLRLSMLLENKIDMALLPEPWLSYALLKGGKLIASDQDIDNFQVVLAFNAKILEEKKQEIAKFLQTMDRVVSEINAHPEKVYQEFLHFSQIPDELATSYPMPLFTQNLLPSANQVKQVNQWLLEKNLIKQPLSFETVVASDLSNK